MLALSFQADFHHRQETLAQGLRIQDGHDPFDRARFLQALDPSEGGRRGQADEAGQLQVRLVSVVLQDAQNAAVDFIEG